MKDITVKVKLSVEWCDEDLGPPEKDDPLRQRIIDSIEEAVWNALRDAEGDGFTHDMENLISLGVKEVHPDERWGM